MVCLGLTFEGLLVRIPNYVALHSNYIAELSVGLNLKDGSGEEKYTDIVSIQAIFED